MALVQIVRKGLQNGLLPYAIEIDGREYGGLRTYGNLELDITPGRHTIVIGRDSSATFDNSDGGVTCIEFKASPWNGKARITIQS